MNYIPLVTRYRPNSLEEIVGQTTTKIILEQSILKDKISQSYLISGYKGTGKTSIARIFAKSINCLAYPTPTVSPCGFCKNCIAISSGTCLDIIELDAASHTGVEKIQDIFAKIHLSPTSCRKKVYIFDECHMLSKASASSLLKRLEDNCNAIFILVTTEPFKLPETIISRCICINLIKVSNQDIANRLAYICQKEQISADTDSLKAIATVSDGSIRDAINRLEQLSLQFMPNQLTDELVYQSLGFLTESNLVYLLQTFKLDYVKLIEVIRYYSSKNVSYLTIKKQLVSYCLEQIKNNCFLYDTTWLRKLNAVRTDSALWFELDMIGLFQLESVSSSESKHIQPTSVNQHNPPDRAGNIRSNTLHNNSEKWWKLLQHLKPATRAFLTQYAQPEWLNETSLNISFKNEKLLKIAITKISELEKAWPKISFTIKLLTHKNS